MQVRDFDAISSFQRDLERELTAAAPAPVTFAAEIPQEPTVAPVPSSLDNVFSETTSMVFAAELERAERLICSKAWGGAIVGESQPIEMPKLLQGFQRTLARAQTRWSAPSESRRDSKCRALTSRAIIVVERQRRSARRACAAAIALYVPLESDMLGRAEVRRDVQDLSDALARAGIEASLDGCNASSDALRRWGQAAALQKEELFSSLAFRLAQMTEKVSPHNLDRDFTATLRACVSAIDARKGEADAYALAADKCLIANVPRGSQERMVAVLAAWKIYSDGR
jgi:hypothetical protein